jgi:hypothetical protein
MSSSLGIGMNTAFVNLTRVEVEAHLSGFFLPPFDLATYGTAYWDVLKPLCVLKVGNSL